MPPSFRRPAASVVALSPQDVVVEVPFSEVETSPSFRRLVTSFSALGTSRWRPGTSSHPWGRTWCYTSPYWLLTTFLRNYNKLMLYLFLEENMNWLYGGSFTFLGIRPRAYPPGRSRRSRPLPPFPSPSTASWTSRRCPWSSSSASPLDSVWRGVFKNLLISVRLWLN